MTIVDELHAAFDNIFEERLRDPKQRELVVSTIMAGFINLKQKPVPDLAERIKGIEKRVSKMVEEVSLGFVNGRLVFKVAGSSESLMTELRHGSNWYEPWEKIDEILLAAILIDPGK